MENLNKVLRFFFCLVFIMYCIQLRLLALLCIACVLLKKGLE